MRRDRALVCALTLFVLTVGSVPSDAQTTAAGPYLAMPAWDQKLQCDTLATCPRFVVLSNWNGEAVLDRETGLVWQRAPKPVNRVWGNASFSCLFQSTGGRFGWRLPTIQELLSVGASDPSGHLVLEPGHPFVLPVPSDGYWSSTTEGPTPDGVLAYGVDYVNGDIPALAKTGVNAGRLQAWCVRGGSGLDRQ
jgi:hypothetical protein